jgi:hypothetical protein
MNRTLPGKVDAAAMAVEDVRPAIFPGVAEMHSLIAMVLAMRSAPALRARMHELMHIADDRPFLLSRFRGTVWIEVGAGNRLRVLRKQVPGLPFVDLDQALRAEPTLKDAIQASIGETGANATAMRLLDPILDTRIFPARADMEELRRWAPLLEHAAYQSGAYAMVWLDAGRPTIVKGQASDAKRMLFPYWTGMHVMAHLVFLASEPDASSWLGEMAQQFHWDTWTPSFPFLRERTMWLATCAARSAIAFGTSVVDRYVGVLAAAAHATKVFDALFGLTAIALRYPAEAPPIVAELQDLRRTSAVWPQHREYVEQMYRDAIDAISCRLPAGHAGNEDTTSLGWRLRGRQGLATMAALRSDPMAMAPSRRLLGISVLPTIVDAPPSDYYPAAGAKRVLHFSDEMIAQILFRAWKADSATPALDS